MEMLRFHSYSELKKRYSSLVFQKVCFKIKLLKTFKIPSDYDIKTRRSLKRKATLKSIV